MPHLRFPAIAALTALAVLAPAGQSHAQPGPPPPPSVPTPVAIDPFLEQRVVEELAADGVILSRLGVVLDLESVGDVVLVTLVDPHTGRPVASTKIDRVPVDRDSAVATITPVAAGLASQLVGKRPDGDAATREHLATLEAQQRDLLARQEAERVERARLATAEREYDAQAIRFGSEAVVSAYNNTISVSYRWRAARGETAVPLSGEEFYRTVGRADLAQAYKQREQLRWGGAIVSGAFMVGAAYAMLTIPEPQADYRRCAPDDFSCRFTADRAAFDAREEAFDSRLKLTIGLMGGGLIGALVYGYYTYRPHPVSERTARQLGADHNRALRVRLGLPVAAAAPTTASARELLVTPYAAGGGGGLTLSGAF